MRQQSPTLRRWLVALVALAALPTLLAAIAALLYAYNEEQAEFRRGLTDTTRALALVLDREIARREAIALTLAGSPTLTRGDLQSFHEYASQIAPTRDKVVVLQALDGQQLVNSRLAFGAALPRSLISAERTAAGPLQTVVSNLYFAPVGKQFSFALQVPVVREGQLKYYLSVAGYASALQSVMDDQRLPPGWLATILDAKGVIVARNVSADEFVGRSAPQATLTQIAGASEGLFDTTSMEGSSMLAAFSKAPSYGWAVVVGVPARYTQGALQVAFAAVAALLLMAAVLAAILAGRRLLLPVEQLKQASRALGSGRPLAAQATGLAETDEVLAALREAQSRIATANQAVEARRREAEAAMQEVRDSEGRLRQLANTIPNLAWMADADGYITWYNDRWYDYTGTTPADMEGWGWQSVHDPAVLPDVMVRWSESIRCGEPFEMTFPLRDKDGVYRPFFTLVAPLRDATGAVVQWFGTNTDVSPLKQAEDDLREADRRKDEFIAMLAHELRNPLAPIRTAAEILSRLPVHEPQVARASQIIARQVAHMSGLLNDLLEVSRISRGLVPIEKELVDVESVVAGALEQVRPLIEARRHALDVRNEDPAAAVMGSRMRLTQVVANLLDNAAKYSPPGSRISIAVRRQHDRCLIEVADTGDGISADLLPHLFEPFTQAERGADRSQGGLGLGLAVVKGLVELQGGTVRAASGGLGCGSSFVVDLPVAPAGTGQSPALVGDQPPAGQGKSLRILLVDDNADAADTLALLLEGDGHRVRCAYTAGQALELLEGSQVDAAVIDIGLPDMSGHELAINIRSRRLPAGRLIALSGYAQARDREASAAAGFARHLVKPVEPGTLLNALESGGDPG